jgi:multiple sugar transport system permease protein
MTTTKSRGLAIKAILLIAICLFCVFPFYFMVTTSLKTQVVALPSPPAWLFSPTLANYTEVLFEDKVGIALINSIIVAVCTTLLAMMLGPPPPMRWHGSNFGAKPTSGSGLSPTAL